MSAPRPPTLEQQPTQEPRPSPGTDRRGPLWTAVLLILAVGIGALLFTLLRSAGEDPAVDPAPPPVDVDEPAPDDQAGVPADATGLPAAAAETAARIEEAARAEDWDRLAELALAGGTDFTATFGAEYTTVDELADYWRGLATEEDLGRILVGLLGLPDWYETGGMYDTVFVTPRFMHEPDSANRALLEEAFHPEWVEMAMADGQYLGWRIGISADGDWMFFVQGD